MSGLRSYQLKALESIRERENDRGVIAIPTGTGKGYLAGHIAEAIGSDRILYLAHRAELISQLADHVERVSGFGRVGIEQAKQRANGEPSIVASVPTLVASNCNRLRQYGPDRFSAIVVDEAHHATASSYRKIWRHFGLLDDDDNKTENPPLPLIGLTATPSRGDGVGLHTIFDDVWYQMSLRQAITDGWLVPIRAYTISTGISLDGVKTRMGDFAESELAAAVSIDHRNEIIYDAYEKNAKGMKTLIFCVNVEHAEIVAEYFLSRGTMACSVHGGMTEWDRKDTFQWFAQTEGAVLTNCQLVTEGVDIPSVECVVMARPTKSRTLYAQCLGRGTRLADGAKDYDDSVAKGKDHCLLLDITDSTSAIGSRAVTVGDIFGLPLPTKPLEGQDILEEAVIQESLFDGAESFSVKGASGYVTTQAIQADLFSEPANIYGSKFLWMDFGSSMYRLDLPSHGSVTITSDPLDRWNAIHNLPQKSGGPQPIGESVSLKKLVHEVESHIISEYPDLRVLITKSARWRGDGPSEKQLELCDRLGIIVPEYATKGQVSMAIGRFFAKKKRQNQS